MKTKLFFIATVIVVFICNQQKANAQANQALSNLTLPTSVNQSLLPQTDSTFDLGSSSKSWRNFYFKGAIYRGSDLFISSPNVSSTYIGNKAGYSNTTGYGNTGVGDSAMYANTTGAYNTATGYYALRANQGVYNTANGSYALIANTSGGYNTAFGSQSLDRNNTGNYNTATGYISLYNNSDGQSNTATGFAALELNKSGSFNTAYGYYSLHSNIYGLYNTAIGDSADVTSGNLTNATAIGAYAKVSQSNSLVLGGTGAYGVNVGISTASPTEKLHIAGTDPGIKLGSSLIKQSGADLFINAPPGSTFPLPGNLILQTKLGGSLFQGNVGIGTSTPLQKLHVAGASILANNATINPSTTANTVIAGAIHDGNGWAVTSGIGGKASVGQAWGIGSIGSNLYFGFSDGVSDNTMQTGIQITGSRNVLLAPGGLGKVGIGTITPGNKLTVANNVTQSPSVSISNTFASTSFVDGLYVTAGNNNGTGGSYFTAWLKPDGSVTGSVSQVNASSVSYNTTSDERLKTNIHQTKFSLADLNKIQVKDYDFINGDKGQTGFIAQQLYKVFPLAVSVGGNDPKVRPWMVDYGRITPLLVKAIQELSSQNDSLKQSNQALTDKLNALSDKVGQIENAMSQCCSSFSTNIQALRSTESIAKTAEAAKLDQNVPNPFTNTSSINYYIPSGFHTAQLIITDISGRVLKTYLITQSGYGKQIISGSELASGMYQYSLLIDGKIIDTKKMMLGK